MQGKFLSLNFIVFFVVLETLTNVSLISFLGPSASISMASLGLGKFRFETYFFFLSFFTKRLLMFHFFFFLDFFFFRSFGFDFGSASLGLGKFRSETLKKLYFFLRNVYY